MKVVHTTYIKDTADKSGKTYRELEALWEELTREVENDRMMNPNDYSHLRKLDGTIAEEVKRRFEKTLFNPEPETDLEEPMTPELDEELATVIETNLETEELENTNIPEEKQSGVEETPTPEGEPQTDEEILSDLFSEES